LNWEAYSAVDSDEEIREMNVAVLVGVFRVRPEPGAALWPNSALRRRTLPSRRSFADANPVGLKFTLISKNDRMETSFELGHHNILM
jgi:hypothetical protein